MDYQCKYYKDADFRCGLASFFTGAPQEPHGSAALARSDLVLSARVAGPFSRLPSSQLVIKGGIVAYGSPSTQQYAARGRAQSL